MRFKGQKDMTGRANGFGKAVAADGTIYAGTFFGYLFEGVGKYIQLSFDAQTSICRCATVWVRGVGWRVAPWLDAWEGDVYK